MRKKPFQRMSKTGYHSYKGAKPHAKRELKKAQKKPMVVEDQFHENEPSHECGLPPVIAAIIVVR